MPHLTLEYSSNVLEPASWDDVFRRAHDVLVEIGQIRRENCKSRAVRRDQYLVGNSRKGEAFIHLDVRFLEGRPAAVKRSIGERLLSLLREHFCADDHSRVLQITVEIRDIRKDEYFKFPPGTLHY